MMAPPGDLVDVYRKADLRLRILLLGDGETSGLVRREESRLRVTAELRHMRDAFNASAVEKAQTSRAGEAEARIAELEDDLRRIASLRARMPQMRTDAPALLTPAEAAQALRVSRSTVYRAVTSGDIHAVP